MTSAPSVTEIVACRVCGSRDLVLGLSLRPTPLANAFTARPDIVDPVYPLQVVICTKCGHVQLRHLVDRDAIFRNYLYVSGTSAAFREHFATYAKQLTDLCGLRAGDLVCEIGSGDGTMLKFWSGTGVRVLGVEPARQIADLAIGDGVPTLPEFFARESGASISNIWGRAKLVIANNVMAHVEDLNSVAAGVYDLLADDGLWAFEVQNLSDMLTHGLWDMIYHEHLDYWDLHSLNYFLNANEFRLLSAQRVDSHGGSLRCVAGRRGVAGSPRESIDDGQHRMGDVPTLVQLRGLETRASLAAVALDSLVRSLYRDGNTVIGFGAPAKMTTLLYQTALARAEIPYVIEESPLKQGLYSPGMHIPIVSIDEAKHVIGGAQMCVIIFAWNFAESIMHRHHGFTSRWIVPLPEPHVRVT